MQTILNMEIKSVLSPYCTPSTYDDVVASVTPPIITLPADAVLPPPVWLVTLQHKQQPEHYILPADAKTFLV